MKVLFRIGLVCGLALAALVGATHASARAACTPGSRIVGVATYTTYCGPAWVSFKVVSKKGTSKYVFKGGECAMEHNGPFKFGVHIGTSTYGVPKPKYNYFQLDAQSSSPGNSKGGGVTWQTKSGTTGSLKKAKITLYNGLKKGSFSGGSTKYPVTGTFHC